LLKSELLNSKEKCTKVIFDKTVMINEERDYTFDSVYDEHVTTKEIFDSTIKPNLDRFIEGYNFSVFAYGQTVYYHIKNIYDRELVKLIQWVLIT
jgi:hypothetical protein